MLSLVQAAPVPEELTTVEALLQTLGSGAFWFQVFVLVVCAPIWFPILKAIYRELDRSLRPEGGVFAHEYTPREAEMLEQREGTAEAPLKSVPHAGPLHRAVRRPAAGPSGPRAGASTGRTGRGLRSARSRGF